MPTLANLGLTYPNPLDPAYADLWGPIINAILVAYDAQFGTRTIAQNFADLALSRAKLLDTSETAHGLGNISGAVTLDYTNGHYQFGTLTGNITSLTINNPPASGTAGWLTLELNQDGTGSRTLTLSSTTYKAAGGTLPTLTTTLGAQDFIYLTTRNGGTTWRVSAEKDVK